MEEVWETGLEVLGHPVTWEVGVESVGKVRARIKEKRGEVAEEGEEKPADTETPLFA